jgi:uncharacterized membrane protein
MDAPGIAHVGFGLASLVLGVGIFSSRKGTDAHRVVGATYVLSMVGLNVTALLIYRMFGGFGVFHVLALINLTLLLAGFFTVLVKRPRENWLRYHYYLMGWAYVGLWAATATEFMVRIVGWSAGVGTVVPTGVVVFLGGALVQLRERRTMTKMGGRTATR